MIAYTTETGDGKGEFQRDEGFSPGWQISNIHDHTIYCTPAGTESKLALTGQLIN